MPAKLEGKVAFITGGGSGIGAACATAFAKEGVSVAIADMDMVGAEGVALQITKEGGKAKAYKLDVADDIAVGNVILEVEKDMGGLHIGVNNAGIGGDLAPTAEQTVAGWHRVISVNLDGVFYCTRHEIAAMRRSGGGSIINMSSILGSVGFAGAAAYVAAKHGVVGLTQASAIDCATENIRINAVGPGFIQTPMLKGLPEDSLAGMAALHPMNRIGKPEEVAALVLFLASPAASFISGSYYPVDGGYLAK